MSASEMGGAFAQVGKAIKIIPVNFNAGKIPPVKKAINLRKRIVCQPKGFISAAEIIPFRLTAIKIWNHSLLYSLKNGGSVWVKSGIKTPNRQKNY
jgi:hypothetical protein